jgi:hypothetical protein
VKTTPKGDKEGKNYDVRYLGQVFYMWSSTTWEVNWSYTGTFSSCMKGHGYAMRRTYVRKSSSMTLNEALPGRQPVSLCFYSFLKGNKEWNHPMMINLWLINLSFIFLQPPSCSCSYLSICMHCILSSRWFLFLCIYMFCI